MTQFRPAVDDQLLAMRVAAGIDDLAGLERFSAATADMVEAIADGAGAFATGEWAPLNRIGDQQGAQLADGVIRLPPGFAEAYAAYVEQGWNTVVPPSQHGGQGLPFTLGSNVLENLGAANMAFTLLPLLTTGAIEALEKHASAAQKDMYLPRLVSGEWSGTMNLTEPQAGSDLGALRTMATPIGQGEHAGKFNISGQKIFITWGEHDLTGNIIHLVLARIPGAPEGSRGISLFIVPKYLVGPDGEPGARNDLKCIAVEKKLGIHASPTCVMSFGENGQCVGELVGRENEGLRAMFTMMNNARINVGNQGVQIAERALQQALAFAAERIQSPRAGATSKDPVAIIEHPDVRRMLVRMRALTEAARALLYYTTGQVDRATAGNAAAGARADVLVPLLKAWATDAAMEVTSMGIQVHGGMGFVEETGAAQHFRDSRIPPIYEGTNGIQAADLVTRKLGMDNGGVLKALLADVAADARTDAPSLAALAQRCSAIADWMLADASLDDRLAGSVPFCSMCAVAVAGWMMLRERRAVDQGAAPALAPAKRVTTAYFLDQIVAEAVGLEAGARAGAQMFYAVSAEELTR